MTILYIDGVDAAEALGRAHNETVVEFNPDVTLVRRDIRDITLVAQTRDNATTIGGRTPKQLADEFAKMISQRDRSRVEHIYLLAGEAGMRKHGEMSLAQGFMQAMAAQGFNHLQVHAIVSPGVPKYGMGIEVVTDRNYSSNRAAAGCVNGFYYKDIHGRNLDMAIFKARDAMELSQKTIDAFQEHSKLSRQQRVENRAKDLSMREYKKQYHKLILARKDDQLYRVNKINILSTGDYKEAMRQPCNTFMAEAAEPMMSAEVSYAIHYLSSQKRFADLIHNDLLTLRANLNWKIEDIVKYLQTHEGKRGESLYYNNIIVPLEQAFQQQDFSIIQPADPVRSLSGEGAALQAHGFFGVGPEPVEVTMREKLEKYRALRESEWWGFHYNFLGLISVVYFISDYLCGTDYFNSKHREIKNSAVTKLLNGVELAEFTAYELNALSDGRLGKIVAHNGGLEAVIAALRPVVDEAFDINFELEQLEVDLDTLGLQPAEGSAASSAAAPAFETFTM